MANDPEGRVRAYRRAQRAVAELKAAAHELLVAAGPVGLSNSELGRFLGIYQGHVGHEGHISRTILHLLEADGVAEQEAPRGRWRVRAQHAANDSESES